MRTMVTLMAMALVMNGIVAHGEVILVDNGQAVAVIVVPEQPTPIEQYAAQEFRDHVRKITGAELSIRSDATGGTRVLIGRAAGTVGVVADDLTLEHYRIRTGPDWLAIAGHDRGTDNPLFLRAVQPGTLFGVYHLLDRVCGVRWLWPGDTGTFTPQTPTLHIPALDVTDGPVLPQRIIRPILSRLEQDRREPIASFPGVPRLSDELAAQLGREEAQWLRRHFMGARASLPFGHSFTNWWERYGQSHPHYFAMLEGERRLKGAADRVKLCVSNPAVLDQIVADWQAQGAPDVLRACPNDSRDFCQCDNCRAWDLPIVTEPGNVDRSMLTYRYVRFWNELSQRATAINPNVRIHGYAYSNYRRPPENMTLADNVWLGYTADMNSLPFDPQRRVYREWEGWSRAGAKLLLRPNWLITGHNWPYLPLRDAHEFFQYAQANGMIATDFDAMVGHWSTQGPYYYLIGRMHTRPDITVDEIIDEYCAAFGRAAPAVRQYLAFWETHTNGYQAQFNRLNQERSLSGRRGQMQSMAILFTREQLAPAVAALERAASLAQGESPVVAQRVQFLRLGLEHTWLTAEAVRKAWLDGGNRAPEGSAERQAMLAAAAALRQFRLNHAETFFDWVEFSSYMESRMGDLTGLRALADSETAR